MKPDIATRTETVPSHGKPFPWRCPECGKKEVRAARVAYTAEIKYDGRLYTVEIPDLFVPRCGACGELAFDIRADEQIARHCEISLAFCPPSRSAPTGRSLGLSQRQLAEHLGVAVGTISRWETGALTQSRAMDRYLRVFFGAPALRVALESNDAFPSLGVEVQSRPKRAADGGLAARRRDAVEVYGLAARSRNARMLTAVTPEALDTRCGERETGLPRSAAASSGSLGGARARV